MMSPSNPNDGHLELVKNTLTKKPVSRPRILQRIEEDTIEASKQLIDHMFTAIDDLFYELSKRASSNNEENLYFESMRELRIKKGGLAQAFIQGLTQGFDDLLQPVTSEHSTRHTDDNESNLSIVEGDDLEVDLARKSMAARSRETFKTELYEISIRLDHLLLQATVTEQNNPIDPMQVTRAFVSSCTEQLNIDIKTRLIIFKLFEKHVLKQLGHIYADVNHILAETGILPKIPKTLSGQDNKSSDATRSEAVPKQENEIETTSSDAQENIPTLADEMTVSISPTTLAAIMAAFRGTAPSLYTTHAREPGQNNYYFYANNPGPVITAPDLAKSLTSKQPIIDQKFAASEQPKNIVPDIVSELLATQNPISPNAVAQPDEDTINLVALFFDKVLEDDDLPIAVQSAICRLQIPILKLALNDSAFLTNKSHPARRLINAITHIGVSFDQSKPIEKDPLFQKVINGVQTINKQYQLDSNIFEQVQTEIEKKMIKDNKKSTVVEKRTTQTEEGKVKIKHARVYAQSTLYDKMKDCTLHPRISEFLTNTWLQVLVITYLKDGKDGATWIENEQVITDLIWLCQPNKDERSIARAQRIKPDVLTKIENGLKSSVDNDDSRTNIIHTLEGTLSSIDDSGEIKEIELSPLSEFQKESLGRSAEAEKSWEEMTALERQQSKYEELSSKFYQMAKDLPVGTWIEYQDEENGRQLRCKLSVKIDAEAYIFVNRLGFKALAKSRRQFAYDMQFKKAKLLNSSPIFDRIMNNIVNHFTQVA